jgi:hypothetical protein
MTQDLVAGIIGGTFGLVFVWVNAGPPLGTALSDALRIAAAIAFAVAAILLATLRRRGGGHDRTSRHAAAPNRRLFRKRYWRIVGAEAALLIAGRVVLVAVHAPQESFVAWIALVVGVHFVAFAAFGVWDAGVRVTGWSLTGLGLLGLPLSATPALPWVPAVSGVLSGVTLLAGTLSWIAKDLARTATATGSGDATPVSEGR